MSAEHMLEPDDGETPQDTEADQVIPQQSSIDHHFAEGNRLKELGLQSAAAAEYQEVIRLKPTHVGAQFNLGGMYLADGRTDDAIRHLREAARLRMCSCVA